MIEEIYNGGESLEERNLIDEFYGIVRNICFPEDCICSRIVYSVVDNYTLFFNIELIIPELAFEECRHKIPELFKDFKEVTLQEKQGDLFGFKTLTIYGVYKKSFVEYNNSG
jgi:hypothetical protein